MGVEVDAAFCERDEHLRVRWLAARRRAPPVHRHPAARCCGPVVVRTFPRTIHASGLERTKSCVQPERARACRTLECRSESIRCAPAEADAVRRPRHQSSCLVLFDHLSRQHPSSCTRRVDSPRLKLTPSVGPLPSSAASISATAHALPSVLVKELNG